MMSAVSLKHCVRSVRWMSETKTFEEILEQDHVLVYTCRGFSMWPLLRQNRDLLVIRKPERELRKYDIVLFKVNGKYLLHRIIEIKGDTVVTAGDHNSFKDHPIDRKIIFGILTAVVRDGKEINVDDLHLRVYGHIVADLFDVKAACMKTGAKLRRIRRRITG